MRKSQIKYFQFINVILLASFMVACTFVPPPGITPITLPGVPHQISGERFRESNGFLSVEAESFQSNRVTTESNQWMVIKGDLLSEGASGQSYLGFIRSHPAFQIQESDAESISIPVDANIVNYKIYVSTPGQYYAWLRTLPENGQDCILQVGVDGYWPDAMTQVEIEQDESLWSWTSKQRSEDASGWKTDRIILNILEPGNHTIMFAVRGGGFKIDQWQMTLDEFYRPALNQ